jgi:hypothetical protein
MTDHDVEALRAEWRREIAVQNNRTVEVLLMIVASENPQQVASAALQSMLVREARDILDSSENTVERSLLRNLVDRARRAPVEPDE